MEVVDEMAKLFEDLDGRHRRFLLMVWRQR
jgi:hypothetical protein